MSSHRLFVALRPPPPIRARLRAAMHGISAARWQDDDQLHLTLRFIGEVDHHRAEDIAAALGGLHAAAITARIAGVGLFERKGWPHTIWAGVEPLAALAGLHRKVDQLLARVGVAAETRAFIPHITLARLNRSAGPVAAFLTQNSNLASPPFDFTHVVLYESEMGHGGSRYHPVARYPLDVPGDVSGDASATSAAATALTSSHVAAKPPSSP
ncbi:MULTISPECIES: RNA 2',3'-cyclic phosphodiesterase [unclassified Sphingopyxis]|uniref:RNA 2',3'-cyclic phosphodiesterase n=1 Tax=unclassified Sphingopyxis TaxID=2614943 RepID=UPI0028605166|nr:MULTISPECIES: RNA 2',3'-cyclic phosphodiesterase [unclassified Sphingopyxis]MDR6833566.1 2'-5' RNA ligase [Sphingopyxis sp. BE122]MDR7225835.1 2'-5' RNA ligase [Sphingopyxis sp. BE259]